MFKFIFTIENLSSDWNKDDLEYVGISLDKIAGLIYSKDIPNINLNNHSECRVNIVLVCNDYIRKLNKDYRSKDKATNVLSFPLLEEIDCEYYLGDIFLAYNFIKKDSIEQDKTFYNHLIHLICHGILHLMGYDHIENIDQAIMENYEIKILSNLGINNPYENI